MEAKISKIDGAKRHLPQRNYGQPVDLAKIRSNLTLTSLIAQESAELAHYCGIDPSIRHRIDEQREARAMAAQSLAMRTERLRDSNERATKVREQQLTYATQPKYSSSHGRERRKPEPMQWNGSGSSRSSWGELTSHTLLFREIARYL